MKNFREAVEFSAAVCFRMWAFWFMAVCRLVWGNKHREKGISHFPSSEQK